ncbi:MAG: glycosyltransferase family 4 protein [Sulfuricella sp.]|nr:glycosyltransferase family 4 protein [Sulfuricella sp.]
MRDRKPLRIVHTEASQGWGGQEIRILTEAQGMIARGHRVTLLTPPGARIFQAARERGIPVEAMPFEKKTLKGVLAMRRWLSDNACDVINTHSSTDSWLVALAQIASARRVPVVRTRHISALVSTSWTTRWLYASASDHVVTTGERLKIALEERLALPPGHATSIPTGIDLNRFSRAAIKSGGAIRSKLGIPADAPVIGIAATLRSWKGHDYLLEAFTGLAEKFPSTHLLIVGDGPRRQHLMERIAATSLTGRIHLIGHREDIPDVLAAMDLFALPSYANEGVPQAIMQAMAMELPVVSTTVGSIDEAVENGITGYLIEPKNTLQLEEKLTVLLGDEALRRQMGEAGRARAQARFSLDAMLDAMEKVFYRALRTHSALKTT